MKPSEAIYFGNVWESYPQNKHHASDGTAGFVII